MIREIRRPTLVVCLATAFLIACGGSSHTFNGPDGGNDVVDMTAAPADLTAPPDLTTLPDMAKTVMSGACTNSMDTAILGMIDVQKVIGGCAQMTFGQEPATKDCIKKNTGLSDGCTTCFDAIIGCTIMHCIMQCISDSAAPACVMCRDTNCNPAFATCSGLKP